MSTALCADDIWAVELTIEFEIVPAPVHTFHYFWAIYRAENLPTFFSLPYNTTERIKVL
jgi:hypothetical protein